MEELIDVDASLGAWLALSLATPVTAQTLRQLRQHFSDVNKLKIELVDYLENGKASSRILNQLLTSQMHQAMRSRAVMQKIEKALTWQQASSDHYLIGWDDPRYPTALIDIQDSPPLLYLQGQPAALSAPLVAIVGSRKASRTALDQAAGWAGDLSRAGIGVVSGLALGIDAAAHRGSLVHSGRTVAVAATAPGCVYPRQHMALAEQIIATGAVITEFPIDTRLRPWHFPRRNRLISGLSLGVVIIEASLPSGSLTTAKHALEQGIEVMAMPGSVLNPQARGCHALIRDGAALVENADDVLACLTTQLQRHLIDVTPSIDHRSIANDEKSGTLPLNIDDPDAQLLLDCLGYDPVPVDQLITWAKLPVERVTAAITRLELANNITRYAGKRYARCKC